MKEALLEHLSDQPFEAPAWLRNAHAQTAWGTLFRAAPPLEGLRKERIDTPDGDFVNVHWFQGAPGSPLVLLMHGLEGSIRSNYIRGTLEKVQALGWSGAAMVFRGCGGELNDTPRAYHAGDTGDLEVVAEALLRRLNPSSLYVAGFSLGANVALKWAGEMGKGLPAQAVAGVSPPFDLKAGVSWIEEQFWGLYARQFLATMLPKALEVAARHPDALDTEVIRGTRSMVEFDNAVTAPLHGFADAHDYYEKASCGRYLEGTRVPALVITSVDDPLIPAETIPREFLRDSPWHVPFVTEHGGHVGFVGRGSSRFEPRYWAEEQIVHFFEVCEERLARRPSIGVGVQKHLVLTDEPFPAPPAPPRTPGRQPMHANHRRFDSVGGPSFALKRARSLGKYPRPGAAPPAP